MTDARPRIDTGTARRLLMDAQGLLANPSRRATTAAVHRLIEKMGYVQLDAINVVERAHHHILFTRFAGYQPRILDRLLERDRRVFEHWTHDASLLPISVFPQWRHRFSGWKEHLNRRRFWQRRKVRDPKALLTRVLDRIETEGPLGSADFENDGGMSGNWWAWKPTKAALEYLWRIGEISVHSRVNFNKIYDLTHRVVPESVVKAETPDRVGHIDWCLQGALDRLVVATSAELADFYGFLSATEARRVLGAMVARGEAIEVDLVSAVGGNPARAFAHPDWQRRARSACDPPGHTRLLSPFDPLIRDRKRLLRVFGFDYRLEAFVPADKRQYGYFVLPILEGDRIVGRLDPKFYRDRDELVIRGLWWERGIRETRARKQALGDALDLYAEQIGATHWTRSTLP